MPADFSDVDDFMQSRQKAASPASDVDQFMQERTKAPSASSSPNPQAEADRPPQQSEAERLVSEQVSKRAGHPVEVGLSTPSVPQTDVHTLAPLESGQIKPDDELTSATRNFNPEDAASVERLRQAGENAGLVEHVPVVETTPRMVAGAADAVGHYAESFTHPEQFGTEGEAAEQRRHAGAELLGAVGEGLSPLMAPAGVANPGPVLTGLASGAAASQGLRAGTKALGGTPGQQDLSEQVGWFLPSTLGLARGLADPSVKAVSTPEVKGATLEAFPEREGGPGRVAVGVAKTPEGVTVSGKFGKTVKSKTFGGNGNAPQIEAPTIEGQSPAGETLPVPQNATQAEAAIQMGDAIQTAQKATAADKAATAIVTGNAPVPDTPQPAPVEQAPPLTDDLLSGISQAIQQVPEEQRPQAIAEAHERLTTALAQQGKVVLGGKLIVVDSEKKASTVAQKLINDEIKNVDETQPEEGEKPEEAAKPAATAEAPPQKSDVDEFMGDRQAIQQGHVTLKKGDEVAFTDNDGTDRTGTVKYAGNLAVRLVDKDGNRFEIAPSKVRGLAADQTEVTHNAAPVESPEKPKAEETPEPKYKHGSTQANIHPESEAAKAIESARQRISDSDLAGDGKEIGAGGNHVTVRYGLDGDIDSVKRYLEQQAPFEASLGKTAAFPPSEHSDGAAVIHAPIESPELHRINGEIEKHGQFAKSNFPEYKPHSTIAYVKPEKASRYSGMSVTEGKKFKVDHISDREGKQHEVQLKGGAAPEKKAEAAAKPHPTETAPAAPLASAEPAKLELTPPPPDIGIKQWIAALPRAQRGYAKKAWDYLQKNGREGLEGEIVPADFGVPESDAETIDQHLIDAYGPGKTEVQSTPEAQHEPVQAKGSAPTTENVPSVPSAASEGGSPSTEVSSAGNGETPEAKPAEPSSGRQNGTGVERPERQPAKRSEPARSGGSGQPVHPAPEREGRGADGQLVESPTPEAPEQAQKTAAELRNQRNFHISDEYAEKVGTGGEITKIKGNLDALETLKKIQAEGREIATPEEQETLAKYVDFGGLVGMLQNYWKPEYAKHYERFQKILTNDEIQEIRETLPNTHYTSLQMVDWMWKAMQHVGFRGGRILEPGMGIGNFIGRMPKKVSAKSEIFGVERNPLTGAMAKLLYPDAKIAVKPFQQFMVPDGSLDAVVGNVPFQDFDVTDDPIYRKLKLNLHNYFIVKALDKLRPGGIAALITSRYTMDNSTGKGQRAREEMAKRADLVAAIRLPDKAFKGNAGTEVVADLLIFKKRASDDVPEAMPDWTTLAPITVEGEAPIKKDLGYGRGTYIENEARTKPKEFMVNKYFVDHPENVLGRHSQEGKMYGPGQYTVKAPEDFTAALEGAMSLIPEKVYGKLKPSQTVQQAPETLEPSELEFAPEDVKPGAFFRDAKGNIRIKESGVGKELPKELDTLAKRKQIGAAIDLRDQLNKTIEAQLSTSDDEPIKDEQKKLAKLYGDYTKKYGTLHDSGLGKVFGDDPEYPKLLALENLDPETKAIARADIFSKRVLAPYNPLRDLPDDPKAAMLKVMADRGYLDTKLMADLLKQPEDQVVKRLTGEGLIYEDPHTGKYFTADEYLSGNVRDKLSVAEAAADTDQKYKGNVEALKKAQPAPLTIHDIQPGLGQTWIPTPIYQSFVSHLYDRRVRPSNIEISRDASGKWLVRVEKAPMSSWQGGGIQAHKLVQHALNQQQPTVWINHTDGTRTMDADATTAARDKLVAIKDEFRSVLRKAPDETVNELEKIYNDTFNSFRLREFTGEHLDFPGMSEEWRNKIRGYQKAMVWRVLQEGRAGIFHAPGLGKTLTMATAGMEARRLKLSRKNMYAVPNHMVPQWREDFKKFYPNANVLAVSDDDFTPTNRAKLMSRIATGDWDAVIVPHSQFDLLPMSPEWERKTINKRLDEYRRVLEDLDEKEDKRTIKQIEKAMDKLESRLNELNTAKKKDSTIAFDQLGVDLMFVDEAHAYKSMAVPSKMGNIGGLSKTASQRALAMEMKGDFMRETHNGRGLVFATGTPITNTVGELYIMTKYLAPEMLESAGIRSFDDWAASFATAITQWEYAPDGVTFKPKTTLSEYVNVPELSTMFRRYAEYLSKDAAKKLSNLKEPEVDRKDHMVKITPVQEPLLEMIAERGEHLMKHPPRTKEERQADNWLKLSGDARKISLDARLYEPELPDHPEAKANHAVTRIKEVLDGSAKERGAVAVFSDFFQHKGPDGKPDFNLFEDMRKKLVKAGVPREQIAIIHEAGDDKDAKEATFAKVRSGKIRVIFGSTDKMGIGTNIQERLKMELHLDQPWRPDQVEQREGRIIRSGNSWDRVNVERLIAEPREGKVMRWDPEQNKEVEKPRPVAFDLQMYQQLERKAHFQEQFLTGNYTGRTMEDTGGEVKLNSQMFALGKAASTGNPDAIRKLKLEHDLRTQQMLERNFQVQRSKYTRSLSNLEYSIPLYEKKLELLKRDVDLWTKATKGGDSGASIEIGNHVLDTKEKREAYFKANPDIRDLVGKKVKIGGIETELTIGERHALNNRTGEWATIPKFEYRLGGEDHVVPYDDKTAETHVTSFLSSFAMRARGLSSIAGSVEKELETKRGDLAKLKQEVSGASPYLAKVEKMEKELAEINKRLGMTSAAEQDEGAATDDGEDSAYSFGWDKIDTTPDEIAASYEPPEDIFPPVITLSQSARAVVNRLTGSTWGGVNMPVEKARKVANGLREVASVSADKGPLEQLAAMFDRASSEGNTSGVVAVAHEGVKPEEMFHGVQRHLGKGSIIDHLPTEDVKALQQDPVWETLSKYLDDHGYKGRSAEIQVAEAAAKIGTLDVGLYMSGLQPEDARRWFVKYVRALAKAHGIEVVAKFAEKIGLTAGSYVSDLINEAKTDEQQTESQGTDQSVHGSGARGSEQSVGRGGSNGIGAQGSGEAEEEGNLYSTAEGKSPNRTPRVEPETTMSMGAVPIPVDAIKNAWEKELKPFTEQAGINFRQALSELQHLIAPRAEVRRETLDAAMRLTGERAKRAFILDHALQGPEKFFDKLPQEYSVDFIDNRKLGTEQGSSELQGLADFMAKTDDETYRAVVEAQVAALSKDAQKLWRNMSEDLKASFLRHIADFKADEDLEPGPLSELSNALLTYKENHYRVLWKVIPGTEGGKTAATPRVVQKRPLQGSKGFLKQSTLDTMSEGLEMGGEPVSYNPVTMFKMSQADSWRYITALNMWNDSLAQGARVFVKKGQPRPEGFEWIEDKIGNVKFPAASGEGMIEAGRWAMREDYARLLNNFLSEDWIRKYAVGRGVMAVKNQLTAWRLGFSPFHALTTSVSAVATQGATGLVHAFNQGVRHADWKAILEGSKTAASALAAPYLLTREGTSAVRYVTTKGQFLSTLRGEDFLKQYPEADQLLDMAFTGGAKLALHEDERLNAIAGLRKAMAEERYIAALIKAPFAANQLLFGPLFDFYIPRAKLGAFMREYSQRLVDYGPEIEAGKTTPEEQARKVWDSVENVFGQMNWDARWWHRTFKSTIQLAFRAFTWFAGNVRLVSDAMRGQLREVWESAKYWNAKVNPESGVKPEAGTTGIPRLDFNFAKLIALAGTFITANALLQLAMTHEGPKDMKDLMAARIGGEDFHGKPRRVTTPAIVFKDWLALRAEGAGSYLSAKQSDLLQGITDVMRNEDFRKTMVHDPDDAWWKQRYDDVTHVLGSPIGVSTFKKERQMGGSAGSSALGLAGFGPPPRSYDWSPAEKKLNEILERQQVAHTQAEMDEFRANREAILSGEKGGKALAKALRDLDTEWIVKMFKKPEVTYEHALDVYNNYADEDEQLILKPYLDKKRANLLKRDPQRVATSEEEE